MTHQDMPHKGEQDDRRTSRRLAQLRAEYRKGEQMLADVEREATEIRESLLRISGAIQVLAELRAEQDESRDG